jgi:S-adenosylmethionine:tRNA ribosyltransferase-isomerase
MHPEWFELSRETAVALNVAKYKGKRIIAVGTTTTRVLESQVDVAGVIVPGQGETDIFIYPPYPFAFVDGLITNFHLPKSTLLMLVSAFVCQPNTKHEFVDFLSSPAGKAYQDAMAHGYKFYSFGDAMFIR